MKKEVFIKNNYRLIKATEATLNKIEAETGVDYRKYPNILDLYDGEFVGELKKSEYHNIVPVVLRNELATLISGTTVTPTFKANYIAIGNNDTPETENDTKLASETMRATFTNRYSIGNTAYLNKYFDSTQVGGDTILEIGVFVDGTGTADSGYLLSRVTTNETMSSNESLTINCEFTIT